MNQTSVEWRGARAIPVKPTRDVTPVPSRKEVAFGSSFTRSRDEVIVDRDEVILDKAMRGDARKSSNDVGQTDESGNDVGQTDAASDLNDAGSSLLEIFGDWDVWDFVVAAGMVLILAGLAFPLISDKRYLAASFPVGLLLIALGGYKSSH